MGKRRLTWDQAEFARVLIDNGLNDCQVARIFGIGHTSVWCLRHGYTYKRPPVGKRRRPAGPGKGNRKLTWEKVSMIRRYHHDGIKLEALAAEFGVTRSNICFIVNRRTWKDPS